ncbi:hypothetical protein ACA910_022023 [Epithemia clementina (nom. ined.)]
MYSLLFNPAEEHRQLRSTIRSFVQDHVEPQANDFNARECFNIDLFRKLADLGVMGLTVPEEYGGVGLSDDSNNNVSAATAVAIVHEELSYSDPAFCLSYLAHSLLLTHNLSMNGNHEQKLQFLPACCTAETIGGMAMSEPGAGTDVLGMQTTATQQQQQQQGSGDWILNGTKMWITNGTLDGQTTGDLFLVYAKTGPARTDITLFLVEKNQPGFRLGQAIRNKLGMRASSTAELVLDHVVVPNSHVVGHVHGATACMMRNLEIERLALAAMGIGIARRALDEMKSYAAQRSAFGASSLYGFGQVQQFLAESYTKYMAGKTYLYATARVLDLQGGGHNNANQNKNANSSSQKNAFSLDAEGTKLYSAQMAKEVADAAIQVLGGNGYVGEYTVERLWRDAKLLEIGGGTNQSHHKNMARAMQQRAQEKLD